MLTRSPSAVEHDWRRVAGASVLPPLLLFLLAVAIGALYVNRIQIDDAFITYRYAANLAQEGRLVYNLQGDSAFATTTPGYAVLLALFATMGGSIPTIAHLLGVLSIFVAGWALQSWLRDVSPLMGMVSGLLVVTSPLLWLVLSMEVLPALGLSLAGFALSWRDRDGAAAVALAGATLLRFDAAVPSLVWGIWRLARRRRQAIAPGALYVALVLLAYGALMALLHAPLPSTLGSKQAQQTLGISGFFEGTTWLSGVLLLTRAYLLQSPLFLGFALLLLPGLFRLLKASPPASARVPFLLLLGWALLHTVLYVSLDVTPYIWYYPPLLLPLYLLVGSGVAAIAGVSATGVRRGATPLLVLFSLFLTFGGAMATHGRMVEQVGRSGDASAPTLASKVLPEAKDEAYRMAGMWLAENTPEGATVGVTEVGIMGYYSERPMIDFLGLLDHGVASALARGDLAWALYARQPDYVVLSDVNPMYGFDVYEDQWFQGAYHPIHTVEAHGFWGGDLTIYKREGASPETGEVAGAPVDAHPLSIRFGEYLELIALRTPDGPWRPEDAVGTTFYWRVLRSPERDYTFFFHLLDEQGRMLSARDAPPLLGTRPTSTWQPGEILADFYPIGLPPIPDAPASLSFEVGFYDSEGMRLPAFDPEGNEFPGGQATFPANELLPATTPVRLAPEQSPDSPTLLVPGYDLAGATLGQEGTALRLQVAACECPVALTVELVDSQSGEVTWQETVQVDVPGALSFTLLPGSASPLSWQLLNVRGQKDGTPLFWIDDAGHPIKEILPLTSLQVRP